MTTCTNCGTTITCGCQQRVASNGKKVCANCITAYEQQLKLAKALTNEKLTGR